MLSRPMNVCVLGRYSSFFNVQFRSLRHGFSIRDEPVSEDSIE